MTETHSERHQPIDSDPVTHHDPVTHMDTHTEISDDDHGHAEPRLGPIDWQAWGYAAVGVVVALLVVGLLALRAG